MREEEAPPTTMGSLPKAAESVADEGESSTAVAVVSVALTPQPLLLGPLPAVGAEWVAGAAETTVHLSAVATTTSQRAREPGVVTVRIGPSITRPEPGTAVKPEARAQSTRKFPREGGREAQRPGVRAVQVTSAPLTRTNTRNPARMALTTPMPPAAVTCHLHHPEDPRPGCLHQEVCPQGGAGVEEVEEVEEEICTEVVAMLEAHQGDTGADPAPPLRVGPPSHQAQPESNKARLIHLDPKTRAGEEMEERRKTK